MQHYKKTTNAIKVATKILPTQFSKSSLDFSSIIFSRFFSDAFLLGIKTGKKNSFLASNFILKIPHFFAKNFFPKNSANYFLKNNYRNGDCDNSAKVARYFGHENHFNTLAFQRFVEAGCLLHKNSLFIKNIANLKIIKYLQRKHFGGFCPNPHLLFFITRFLCITKFCEYHLLRKPFSVQPIIKIDYG